jgi:hypothetical protein
MYCIDIYNYTYCSTVMDAREVVVLITGAHKVKQDEVTIEHD